MFTGDGQKFVGDDGLVQRVEFGTVTTGDGATPLPVGLYLVLAVATPSGFPPNTTGGAVSAGDILRVSAGDVIVMLATEAVVELVCEDLCDISSFTMPFSKQEIDVTTLCDTIKKYRAGKSDMQGSIKGIFTAGITDDEEGFLREFIKVIKQDGDTSFDVFEQRESIFLGVFFINKNENIADRMAIVAPFILFGMQLGAELGAAQAFTGNFRFANKKYDDGTYEVDIEPTFCRWGINTST